MGTNCVRCTPEMHTCLPAGCRDGAIQQGGPHRSLGAIRELYEWVIALVGIHLQPGHDMG